MTHSYLCGSALPDVLVGSPQQKKKENGPLIFCCIHHTESNPTRTWDQFDVGARNMCKAKTKQHTQTTLGILVMEPFNKSTGWMEFLKIL